MARQALGVAAVIAFIAAASAAGAAATGQPSGGRVLFRDSLAQSKRGWATFDDDRGSVRFADRGLVLQATKPATTVLAGVPAARHWGDVSVAVDLSLTKPSPDAQAAAGIACRTAGLSTDAVLPRYELFADAGGTVGIDKFDGLTVLRLGRGLRPELFHPGGNRLRADCRNGADGLSLRLFVNDQPAIDAHDPDPLSGTSTGLFVGALPGQPVPVSARFTTLVVTDPSEGSTEPPALPVATRASPSGTRIVAAPLSRPALGFRSGTSAGATAKFTDQGYEIALDQPSAAFVVRAGMPRGAVGPGSPTTLTVEASVTKRHGGRGDFGVVCRATAGDAGYVFSIDDDGFVAIQRYDGSPTGWRVLARLAAPSHAVKRRHRNDVVGTCTGAPGQPQHLTLVVNGYRVLDAQDNRPLDVGPGAGLSVKADGGAPVSVRFDHFVVRVSG